MTHRVLVAMPSGSPQRQLLGAVCGVLTRHGLFHTVELSLEPTVPKQLLMDRLVSRAPFYRALQALSNVRHAQSRLRRELLYHRPDLVVMADDHSPEAYVLAHQARGLGIPTVGILWSHTMARQVLEQVQAEVIDRMVAAMSPFERWLSANLARRWPQFGRPDSNGLRWVTAPLTQLALQCRGVRPHRVGAGGGLTDLFLVPGEAYRQIFLENGDSPDRIVATGSPLLDELYARGSGPETERQQVLADFGFRAGDRLVVVASDFPLRASLPQHEMALHLGEAVAMVADGLPDAYIVVKLHPRWDESTHPIDFSGLPHGDRIRVVKHYDITSLIVACDLWICGIGSFTGIQAVAADKVCLAYDFDHAALGELSFQEYCKIEGIVSISDREGFSRFIRQIGLNAPSLSVLAAARRRSRDSYMAGCTGSHHRIAQICTALLTRQAGV